MRTRATQRCRIPARRLCDTSRMVSDPVSGCGPRARGGAGARFGSIRCRQEPASGTGRQGRVAAGMPGGSRDPLRRPRNSPYSNRRRGGALVRARLCPRAGPVLSDGARPPDWRRAGSPNSSVTRRSTSDRKMRTWRLAASARRQTALARRRVAGGPRRLLPPGSTAALEKFGRWISPEIWLLGVDPEPWQAGGLARGGAAPSARSELGPWARSFERADQLTRLGRDRGARTVGLVAERGQGVDSAGRSQGRTARGRRTHPPTPVGSGFQQLGAGAREDLDRSRPCSPPIRISAFIFRAPLH